MASTSTVKRFGYVLDLICALLAVVLISFGVYVYVSYDVNEVGAVACFAYIGVGVATLVMFPRCLAVMKSNVCCTITFIIFLWAVIIGQFVVVFFMTKARDNVASNLANSLDHAWEEELKSPGAMSLYENWFQCCGRGSPQDYIVNERIPPATCFKNHDPSKSDNLIDTGCRMEFENYWINLLNIFNILAWILVGIEILASFVSCCVCNSIRNERRRMYI